MRKAFLSAFVLLGLIGAEANTLQAASTIKHKRHKKTIKRVGVGAAGGAAVGALAGGPVGAAVGAGAGAGAGALYDKHKKHQGKL